MLCFCLALALLMAWVFADHHDVAVATNDLALVADRLDAWLHLHGFSLLLVAIHDPAAGEVVRRKLYNHAVSRKNADVVLTHFSADVSKHHMTVV